MELHQSVSDMITRCPKCHTSFRITQGQLQTAKGSVRCGSCLHIFKAMDHLIQNKAGPSANPANPRIKSDEPNRKPRKPVGIRPESSKAKTQSNEQLAEKRNFDPTNATVVRPISAKPSFEYHKPKSAPVSTQDIERALRSSVEADEEVAAPVKPETPKTTPKPEQPTSGIIDELEKSVFGDDSDSIDEMDLELAADIEADMEFDSDDLDTDFPEDDSIAAFKLPELKPETKQQAAPVKADNPPDFGIPDDILDEDSSPDMAEENIQQNMLNFDQAAIDRNTGEFPAVSEDDILISDDMDLDDDDEPKSSKEAYGNDLEESFLDLDSWAPKETSLFDRKSKPPKEEEDSDDRHDPDESWAIDLLEDDDDDDSPSYSGVHNALDELDLEMDQPDYQPPEEEYSRATTGSFNALEDSDIEEALGEPLGEHIEPKINAKEKDSEEELYPEFSYPEESDDNYSDSYGDEDYGDEYGSSDYYSEEDRSALIKGIRPAPVEFDNYSGKRDWKKTLIWGGSTTFFSLLLIIQVAWLQFDTLSRQQPYRSLYSFFCPVFACEVPTMAAPNMIRASNLVVRSHPNADNALMVDTILLNTAPFNQPFPDVVLNFSNVEGKTLAARRFKPVEYLGGELVGQSQMPIGQPVHLTLEIVDPGPDAVSYSAYIPN